MIIKFYDKVNDQLLKFAVIVAKSEGKWVFCKHKERSTYEIPGGHREKGETIEETAMRELYEETGAIRYTLVPICSYSVTGTEKKIENNKETYGMLYYADIIEFEKELHSEMEKVLLFDALPDDNWTYPIIQKALVERFLQKHKVFGKREKATYMDREGAYIIPFNNEKIGVVKTPKGYFLLGGGIDGNEEHEECIKRECLEETGYSVKVSKKICSAETFTNHSSLGYFHPIQHYYFGTIIKKIQEPVESDHAFVWLDIDKAKGNMHPQMQNWAIEQAILLRKKQ